MNPSSESLEPIGAAWKDVLPTGVEFEAGRVMDCSHELSPEERSATEYASPTRLHEFSTARRSAHRLIQKWGIQVPAVPRDPDSGEPKWPESLVGSITHCKGLYSVVAARRSDYRSIGIDLEKRGRMHLKMQPKIASDEEIQALCSSPIHPEIENSLTALTAIFSLKEAFYKCHYPLHRQWLGFRDVEIRTRENGIDFSIVRTDLDLSRDCPFEARVAVAEHHVISAVYCPNS